MNASYINPFVESTVNVLATMTGVTPQRGKLFVKQGISPTFDISAIIGIAGDVHGSVVISFPREVVLKLVSAFIGEQKNAIDEDVQDAVGEFVNMITGGAKKNLSAMGVRFKLSIPSVIVGRGHTISRPRNVPCIVLPFAIEGVGKFAVEVAIKELV